MYMTELVPFQEKRGKQFPENTTPLQAITIELRKYFSDYYPTLEFGTDELDLPPNVLVLDTQKITSLPTFESFSHEVARVTSPALLTDVSIPWTLRRLEVPMLLLIFAAKKITKSPYLLLPKPYQKILKRVYTSQETNDKFAVFLESKKRAKKYMRIFQKRLGIYSKRKPPFSKASATSPRSTVL